MRIFNRFKPLHLFLVLVFSMFLLGSHRVTAATLLSDDFTGTTIDTTKWTEVDPGNLGGSAGDIQQNGSLTAGGSYISSNWGNRALVSKDNFDNTALEIQADFGYNSDALMGYGDYDFDNSGTSGNAYILDVQAGGNTLGLVWSNGNFGGAASCGSNSGTHTWKMKIISGGFEIYKDGSLLCSMSTATTVNNAHMFLEASAAAATYDNVLVTGTASGPTAPAKVTGVTTDAGDHQVSLSWSAPTNGGSAITDYLVEYKLSTDSVYSTFADGTSTATSAIVTGLTNNSTYNFKVSAINTVGTGTASDPVSATPIAPTAPGIPTSLVATPGNNQVALSWTAPASNGSAITDYVIEYKLTSDSVYSTFSDGTSTATSAVVTGLTNGNSYDFRVKAVNSIGTGSASSSATTTPAALGYVLTDDFTGTTINTSKWDEVDPSGVGGTSGKVQQNGTLSINNSYVGGQWGDSALVSQDTFKKDSLEISFKAPTVGSSSLVGYGNYAFGGSSAKAFLLYLTGDTGTQILGLNWENGSYTSNNCGTVTAGATYKLKVVSGGFEIYVNDVKQCTFTTSTAIDNAHVFLEAATTAGTFDDFQVYGMTTVHTAPGAPSIGTATGGNHQATITFSAPVSNGGVAISDYTVTSNPGNITAHGSSSPITVTGLTNGVSYSFTVTATNTVGTSSPSSASNTVIPALPAAPAQVTGLVATGVNQQVLLGWTPVTATDPVTDYKIEYKLSTDSSWTTFTDGVSTSAKATVTGLINGSSYDFRVSATNSGGYGTVSSTATATPQEIDHLAFVITGESNSGGIGLNSDASSNELLPRSSVQIMNLTSGLFQFEDLHIGVNNLRDHAGLSSYYDNSHGFELQLANSTEAHAFPDNDQVYLVKTGQGGSRVGEWTVGNGSGYWAKFLERTGYAKTEIPSDHRQWVVWISLGINDAISGYDPSLWKADMIAHINKIKAELPGAIVVMTEFQSMTNQSGYATYNAKMDEIAAEQPNVFVIDSTGASLRDQNHWSDAGLRTVTSRMVTVTKNELGLNTPGKPTNFTATPTGSTAALSWTAPVSNGGASIINYKIQYKLSSSQTWTTFSHSASTTTSATITGLNGSSDYDFQVAAENSNGTGNFTSTDATTPDTTAPTVTIIGTDSTSNSTTITWNTDKLASTQVEYGISTDYGVTTSETDTSPRVLSHSVTINNLVPCAIYFFRAKSQDSATNVGYSDDSAFSTKGCTGTDSEIRTTSTQIDDSTSGTANHVNGDSRVSLNIPAGTVGSNATFVIRQLNTNDATTVLGNPNKLVPINGQTYQFTALVDVNTEADSFNHPITVTIHYSDAQISHIQESSLVIYHYTGGAWVPLNPCTINAANNTISCTTNSFSLFALFGAASSSGTKVIGSMPNPEPKPIVHSTGTNIKGSDGTIYTLTADGKRSPYTSAGAFLSYGFNSFASVVDASLSDMQIPLGSFIPPRDGSIICSDRGADKGTCYLITDGKKAGFTSATVFKALGFNFAGAMSGDVSFMETAPNIDTAQQAHLYGTLIKNGQTLQLIGHSQLVGIPSMSVLTSWGYNPATAVIANAFDKLITQGTVLTERLAGVLKF